MAGWYLLQFVRERWVHNIIYRYTYTTAGSYGVLGRDFFPVQRNRSVSFAVVNPRQWQTVIIRWRWYASVVFEHPTWVDFPLVLVHLNRAQVAKRLARHPVFHLQITCISLNYWLLLLLLFCNGSLMKLYNILYFDAFIQKCPQVLFQIVGLDIHANDVVFDDVRFPFVGPQSQVLAEHAQRSV